MITLGIFLVIGGVFCEHESLAIAMILVGAFSFFYGIGEILNP